ncbi:MAG: AAA family ATPase [Caldilinea sp. CFX5]|nr:AAA family ATPase [Caldilinea sp. CFX5]
MLKPVQASSPTFRDIIEGGFLYVDKTRDLYELVRYSKGIYFLARPRRFGKSLTISILEEIFKGEKELFRDLWLYTSDYRWQAYPIIRLDFNQERVQSAEALQEVLTTYLERVAARYQITLPRSNYQRQFLQLIEKLAEQGPVGQKKVVILIDEYDKPILDNIENPAEALRIRDTLKGFYGVIKAMDPYLRFVFITGISKFSRVGIFSDMNNLTDLTMVPRFATTLGLTDQELRQNFAEHISDFAQQEALAEEEFLQKIRTWYDGFRFVEEQPSVYNPFSTLQLFNLRRFSNYWFETGTPTFLIKMIKQRDYTIEQLHALRLSELAFSTYEIDRLEIVPLLFQTGYLTIKEYDRAEGIYTLGYPNREIEGAFLTYLLSAFSERERGLNEEYLLRLLDALKAKQFKQFFSVLDVFFVNVPYTIHLKHEKYYQSLFYLIFKMLGLRIDVEVSTNEGRIDAVISLADQIFLFEFKLDGSADEALQQIKDNHYYQKYQLSSKPITLVGANFDSNERKITDWKTEALVTSK